jgi:Ca-activated chloride channel family protein
MGEFHWLRPYGLLSLLPAMAIWWGLWRHQDQIASWRKAVDPHLLEHLLVGQRKRRVLRPVHLLLVVWVLTALALAGPTWRREPSPFADDEAGLVVLMKVSGTMNATDVQPSRLERAKHKLRDLLERRQGSSTGLIVYSGSAHLVMPLTRDDRIISAMVADLTPELMPVDGDALGAALALAETTLQRAGVPGSVLILADTVAPSQAQLLSERKSALPVQILALKSSGARADPGLQQAAGALNAAVVSLTVDPTDVERVARRAQSDFKAVASEIGGDRWQDAGYALVPLIAVCALMWSRKGWVVQ